MTTKKSQNFGEPRDFNLKLEAENKLQRPFSGEGESFKFPAMDAMIAENKWICPINLVHQDNAYFSISKNQITLPEKSQFKDGESFYDTAFHEMTHSTGTAEMFNRFNPESGFGSAEYAKEELVAELGSALVAQRYGMTKNLKDDSAAYLKSWLDSLKESPSFIKTTLMDVKRATSVITQRIDEVALELEAKQSQTNDKSVSMDAEAKVEKPQQEVPKPELEEVVARSAWHR